MADGRALRSVNVLPVFLFQQPGKCGEYEQEQHDPQADAATSYLRRVSCVIEEVDRIAHEAVKLLRFQATGSDRLEVLHRLALWTSRTGRKHRCLHTLE